MSIKSNLCYSAALTFSTYLVPLIVFPYISRILGPTGIGAVETIDGIIDYCVLFSMMGMSSLGIREIASNKNDKIALQKAFNNLFGLHAITTGIALLLLCLATLLLPNLQQRLPLLMVGSIKLLFNLFWIEWFYRGLEDFRYITIRSVLVRMAFVVSVFLLVKTQEDYVVYYCLFVGIVVANALCNWTYKRKWVHLCIKDIQLKKYAVPFLFLGLFALLSAIYTKLSLPVLSFMCGEEEAGYYAVACRIYQVIIALISSLISVLIPRMSIYIKEKNTESIISLYNTAFLLVFFLGIPIIIYMEFLAKDLVVLFAGSNFTNAVTSMRIMVLVTLIVGIEQIIIMQLLIPLHQDKYVVRCALYGVFAWLFLSLVLIPHFASTGTALTWLLSETTVLGGAIRILKKKFSFPLPWSNLLRHIVYDIPYIAMSWLVCRFVESPLTRLSVCGILYLGYIILLWKGVIKAQTSSINK